jgi:hypothetical protein
MFLLGSIFKLIIVTAVKTLFDGRSTRFRARS